MRINIFPTALCKVFAAVVTSASLLATPAIAVEPDSSWDAVLEEARGQTVYFNAWGGSDRINEYLQWAGDRLEADYGVISLRWSDNLKPQNRLVVTKMATSI